MSDNTISTLDGSTFLVSNRNGDIDARPDQPEGLFFKDTRHLSKWLLTINGIALDVLSTDAIEYCSRSTSAFRRQVPFTRTPPFHWCGAVLSATASWRI